MMPRRYFCHSNHFTFSTIFRKFINRFIAQIYVEICMLLTTQPKYLITKTIKSYNLMFTHIDLGLFHLQNFDNMLLKFLVQYNF